MKPLSDARVSELQARAYGPNQPPLSEVELAQLRRLNERAEDSPAETGTRARDRSSTAGGLSVAVGVGVLFAGLTGYAYGSGTLNTVSPESEQFGSGIEIEPGDVRQFNDADCELVLSTEDGTLSGAHCVWEDGAEVTVPARSSEDSTS